MYDRKFLVKPSLTVQETISYMKSEGIKAVLIVEEDMHLDGIFSIGDMRNYILHKGIMEEPITNGMNPHPIVFRSLEEIENCEYQLVLYPVIDEEGRFIDLVDPDDPEKYHQELNGVPVVIMAGGKGTRLYPYTKILPKPLIPIKEIPIVERIVNRFYDKGVRTFYMTVNYKKAMIKSYFDEIDPGYEIRYVEEERPLGTGGSLKLIEEKFDRPLFVTNCDILIEADLGDIYRHHRRSGNAVTIVSSLKNLVVPYGVLNVSDDGQILSMQEKPRHSYFINTGMYVIDPELIDLIPDDTFYHMPQLVEECMNRGLKTGIYSISEDAFLDMGEFEEMKRMEERLGV